MGEEHTGVLEEDAIPGSRGTSEGDRWTPRDAGGGQCCPHEQGMLEGGQVEIWGCWMGWCCPHEQGTSGGMYR